MAAPENDLNKALELARLKKKHLEEILNITIKQSEVLSADKAEQLLSYIQDRQKLIDAIKVLDEKFTPIFNKIREQLPLNGYDAVLDDGSDEYNLSVQLLTEIDAQKELLKAIYDLEQKNQKQVMAVIEEVKSKMSGISRAKRGYKAYKQPNQYMGGIFIDKRE